MAHLHGERAFGTGGGSSNQNLIGDLDRDSGDSSDTSDPVSRPGSGGTSRLSTGSDLESFDEQPELEARLRESSRRLPSVDLELENAPPISGPVTAPLQFAGIVSASQTFRSRIARSG